MIDLRSWNAHEILMKQLPYWFKPVLEYIELMELYGWQLDMIDTAAMELYENQFIQTADEELVAIWEGVFGFIVKPSDTLEYRRERLMQKFLSILPYTYWDLRDRLRELYDDDFELRCEPENNAIFITVTSDRYGAVELLYELVWDVVPVHLIIAMNQETEDFIHSTHYIGAFTTRCFVQTIPPGGN